MTRGRRLPLAVLVAALAALGASLAWAAGRSDHHVRLSRYGPMMGISSPMLDVGNTPVGDLSAARRRADALASRFGLHAGEVMRFTRNYYAELLDAAGNGATEVLVDPRTGTTMVEPGPAMRWNTRFGMMGRATGMMTGAAYRGAGMMGSATGSEG